MIAPPRGESRVQSTSLVVGVEAVELARFAGVPMGAAVTFPVEIDEAF
jgi:hypothetical protein